MVLGDRVRVFTGLRDADGKARIGWVDLDARDPTKVLAICTRPSLDLGAPGAFDDSGVVPTCLVRKEGRIYLYYAGYQRGVQVRFLAFGGLAVSDDDGVTFQRVSRTPVFDRTEDDLLFRVPHSVMHEDGVYRFWYGGGDRFEQGAHKTLPAYDIRYLESPALDEVPKAGQVCLTVKGAEHRVGRPCVVKRGPGDYVMFYGYGTPTSPYNLGVAFSQDGRSWERRDELMGLPLSATGMDAEMMGYPGFFEAHGKRYLLYSGNGYGVDGFFLARLLDW